MYDSVLVPTDGSDGSERAVEHAVDLATQYDATLHTLYVVESTRLSGLSDSDGVLESLEDAGRRAVDEVVSLAHAEDVDSIEASVARGVPHEAILTYVDDRDIDLVVMGTHGRSGLSKDLLGSVTEKIVRSASVPVLTVHIGEE
ncbi:universal stress protein [Haloarculaceae archaeon H-GB11]|nr:universal stress protein [Haloarculaceae archaeon H-GB11]